MTNKNKPVNQRYKEIKYKIIVKGDQTETPVMYHGKEMVFRTKFTLNVFLKELNKDSTREYEWIGI